MTKQPALVIENLSKKYIISHQKQVGSSYVALSEVLAHKAKTALTNPAKLFNQKLSKEEFWALRDINLEIKQGDKVAIIGHNGAGKSTLLKILSQITEPTTGKITINGRVSSLLEVGTGFHPELTGRENIYLNGSILGMSHAEVKRKFDEIVAFSGVEQFLDTPVKRYSSGMRMRLGFAVAAHLESEILVIDEVLAVGDAAFQQKCIGKMDEVAKSEGRTILFVSHNMAAVKSLCNKGVVLKRGGVHYNGSVNGAIDAYLESRDDTLKMGALTLADNKMGKGRGVFTSITYTDATGNPVPCMDVCDFYNIDVAFTAAEGFNGGTLQLTVYNADNTLMINYNAELPHNTNWQPGKSYRFRMAINNYLAPGTYSANLSIKHHQDAVNKVEGVAYPVSEVIKGQSKNSFIGAFHVQPSLEVMEI